jgi:hypothetical protein
MEVQILRFPEVISCGQSAVVQEHKAREIGSEPILGFLSLLYELVQPLSNLLLQGLEYRHFNDKRDLRRDDRRHWDLAIIMLVRVL